MLKTIKTSIEDIFLDNPIIIMIIIVIMIMMIIIKILTIMIKILTIIIKINIIAICFYYQVLSTTLLSVKPWSLFVVLH